MIACPCCSGETFDECCEPIINRENAQTALALMRSRYTAYYFHEAEYIYRTTHPKTRLNISLNEITQWAKENTWTKLEIVNFEKGNESDSKGMVEFKAHYFDKNGAPQIQHEKSNFLNEFGKWFYAGGFVSPQKPISVKPISRNAPCVCGSGRKYKNCCG